MLIKGESYFRPARVLECVAPAGVLECVAPADGPTWAAVLEKWGCTVLLCFFF
jgi:hypothetical protein